MRLFYEFFAGGGMARAGLGEDWACIFANDFDPRKAAAYAANWGEEELKVCDIRILTKKDLPGRADLAWASFPCQDLSLAGAGSGLNGARSGAFWPFWSLMRELDGENRAPALVVLENVCGALTSHGGKDFAEICAALASTGYAFGALVIDAVHFVPQSRPRLFIVGVRGQRRIPRNLIFDRDAGPAGSWRNRALLRVHEKLPPRLRESWVWWRLPEPPARKIALADLIEDGPGGVVWNSDEATLRLLKMMTPVNRQKVERAQKAGRRVVGTIYKRARPDGNGGRRQRAEVRFDGVAGCLRTPAGGSSRQTLIIVDGDTVRTRLISPREAARLMGLPESYRVPARYNDACHLAGDGVAAPVVRFLARHLLQPLLEADDASSRKAARPGGGRPKENFASLL